MKEFLKADIDESPIMIVIGILSFYLLIEFFAVYLFLLHRISFYAFVIVSTLFTLLYLPRFLIIYQIKTKDKISIHEDFLIINDKQIQFTEIEDFKVIKNKPKVVFFINNKMIVFQKAKFILKIPDTTIEFTAIGSEKIQLLKEFFEMLH
jgi:hypothetical protein